MDMGKLTLAERIMLLVIVIVVIGLLATHRGRVASGSQARYAWVKIDGLEVKEAIEENAQVLKLRGDALIQLNRYMGEIEKRLALLEYCFQCSREKQELEPFETKPHIAPLQGEEIE